MILRVISYLLYLLIAGAGIVLVLDKWEWPQEENVYVNPCSEPVSYYVADIDPRFDITKNQLIRLLDAAGALWGDAVNRRLLHYDPDGDVAIQLIYDERQQLIEEERGFTNEIQMERMKFDRLHRDYIRSSEQYDKTLERYNSLLEEYDEKVQMHHDELQQWNSEGGVPEGEEQRVRGREEELGRMRGDLLVRKNDLDRTGKALEDLTDRLNEISTRQDGLIVEYNEQFSGEYRFNQGEYKNASGQQSIHIYHYKSLNHLRLVLAHELGHALGLGHVDAPSSVMYPVVESDNTSELRLTMEDITAIQNRCR